MNNLQHKKLLTLERRSYTFKTKPGFIVSSKIESVFFIPIHIPMRIYSNDFGVYKNFIVLKKNYKNIIIKENFPSFLNIQKHFKKLKIRERKEV